VPLVVGSLVVGLLFAGSPARLAEGVAVGGVDVGGLTAAEAKLLLETRAKRVAGVPVTFTAGTDRFEIKATQLGAEADWGAAIAAAQHAGDGFGPVRGFRRLHVRVFGSEIAPPVRVYTAALDFKLSQLTKAIDRNHVEAKLVRRGLSVSVVRGQDGRHLDHEAAGSVIVRALASLDRGRRTVALPLEVDPVSVTAAELAPVAARARIALSAPVRLAHGETRWRLPRWRIAELLTLPTDGATKLAIAGPGAERYFERLSATVGRPPADAGFAVAGDGTVSVVPARPGLEVDVPRTSEALLAAVVSRDRRIAQLAVKTSAPDRTTAEAQAMGIERRLASYTTLNAGTWDRITNLRRAIDLLDGALVAPGGTFSFNTRVGERTLERGFRPAPVIVKDEYDEAVGGGVSQVATTVFNAAWEAGLKIVERNPHSLYISRYQLGRDATVNYPDLDLRFVNDTPKWIMVGGAWDGGGITVSIYGGGPERRVESSAGTMRITGPARVRREEDPTLEVGTSELEAEGSEARATSVTRKVYLEDGTLLHDETWNTSYRGEYRIIRVGTKPKPKPKEPSKAPPKDEAPAPGTKPPATPTTTTPTTPAPTTAAEPAPTPTVTG
jgi:vancomycin resistance protein YoaR